LKAATAREKKVRGRKAKPAELVALHGDTRRLGRAAMRARAIGFSAAENQITPRAEPDTYCHFSRTSAGLTVSARGKLGLGVLCPGRRLSRFGLSRQPKWALLHHPD
jgi:hypothetical protein